MTPAADPSMSAPILHVDMDAFFASVEVRGAPHLRGRPVIVGGTGRRGVVCSASYEARALGVRSAMPMSQARRLAPQATVITPNPGRYGPVSEAVMTILESITPVVEQVSVDEAFLDTRPALRLFGSPAQIAHDIRAKVLAEQRITCSVGLAATKSVAKLASDACKPDGMLVVPVDRTQEFLDPQPVGALWGVGPKTAERLQRLGIAHVSDIRAAPQAVLRKALGVAAGQHVWHMAHGTDGRPVEPGPRREKSVGAERTFGVDVCEPDAIDREVLALCEEVAARARAAGLVGTQVSLKLRYADFHTITRQKRLPGPVDTAGQMVQTVRRLLAAERHRSPWIRLIGVRLEHLSLSAEHGEQLMLGDVGSDRRAAARAMDAVNARFGREAVSPAALLRGKLNDLGG